MILPNGIYTNDEIEMSNCDAEFWTATDLLGNETACNGKPRHGLPFPVHHYTSYIYARGKLVGYGRFDKNLNRMN